MNVFIVLYVTLTVSFTAFVLDHYSQIEETVVSMVASFDTIQLANLWIFVVLGVVYLNIVYLMYNLLITRRQNTLGDKRKLERV